MARRGYEHLFENSYESHEENYIDRLEDLPNKRKIRQLIEEKLEKKRLKAEFQDDLDELDGEFDWDDIYR